MKFMMATIDFEWSDSTKTLQEIHKDGRWPQVISASEGNYGYSEQTTYSCGDIFVLLGCRSFPRLTACDYVDKFGTPKDGQRAPEPKYTVPITTKSQGKMCLLKMLPRKPIEHVYRTVRDLLETFPRFVKVNRAFRPRVGSGKQIDVGSTMELHWTLKMENQTYVVCGCQKQLVALSLDTRGDFTYTEDDSLYTLVHINKRFPLPQRVKFKQKPAGLLTDDILLMDSVKVNFLVAVGIPAAKKEEGGCIRSDPQLVLLSADSDDTPFYVATNTESAGYTKLVKEIEENVNVDVIQDFDVVLKTTPMDVHRLSMFNLSTMTLDETYSYKGCKPIPPPKPKSTDHQLSFCDTSLASIQARPERLSKSAEDLLKFYVKMSGPQRSQTMDLKCVEIDTDEPKEKPTLTKRRSRPLETQRTYGNSDQCSEPPGLHSRFADSVFGDTEGSDSEVEYSYVEGDVLKRMIQSRPDDTKRSEVSESSDSDDNYLHPENFKEPHTPKPGQGRQTLTTVSAPGCSTGRVMSPKFNMVGFPRKMSLPVDLPSVRDTFKRGGRIRGESTSECSPVNRRKDKALRKSKSLMKPTRPAFFKRSPTEGQRDNKLSDSPPGNGVLSVYSREKGERRFDPVDPVGTSLYSQVNEESDCYEQAWGEHASRLAVVPEPQQEDASEDAVSDTYQKVWCASSAAAQPPSGNSTSLKSHDAHGKFFHAKNTLLRKTVKEINEPMRRKRLSGLWASTLVDREVRPKSGTLSPMSWCQFIKSATMTLGQNQRSLTMARCQDRLTNDAPLQSAAQGYSDANLERLVRNITNLSIDELAIVLEAFGHPNTASILRNKMVDGLMFTKIDKKILKSEPINADELDCICLKRLQKGKMPKMTPDDDAE